MTARKNRTPYLDKIIKEYIQGVSEYYPGLKFSERRSTYSGDEPKSCDLEFGLYSGNLKGTHYVFSKNKSFIHYTSSLQSLFEILNTGYLRLSNLQSLNDPQELCFLQNTLGIRFTPDQINEFKNQYFTASFCKILDEDKPDSFPMWRLYGGDGYGAAIVFEVLNAKANWFKYLFAKVQYGQNRSLTKFRDFLAFHNDFQLRYHNPIQNWPKSLIALMALHKNQIWSYEKEIRLLTHYPFDEYSLEEHAWDSQMCNLKHSISKNGKHYSYVELPLFDSIEYKRLKTRMKELGYEGHLETSMPILKIKKIILGYRLGDNFFTTQDIVKHISKDQYGYNFAVSDSHLRKDMA